MHTKIFSVSARLTTALILLSAWFITVPVQAQTWDSLGSGASGHIRCFFVDTTDNTLYTGGNFMFADDTLVNGIARLEGNVWRPLGSGVNNCAGGCQPVLAITKFHDELYMGGHFFGAGGVAAQGVAKWNGNSWETVGGGVNGLVGDFYVYQDALYAGGRFDSAGSIMANSIAKWDGITWNEEGRFPNNNTGTSFNDAGPFVVYKSELYVGGLFEDESKSIKNMARFDGASWKSVGEGIPGGIVTVQAFEIYKEELYVGGYFMESDGNTANFIKKWDGSKWTKVGQGVDGEIKDLMVYQNRLYAVGNFTHAGDVPADHFAAWDGQRWCGYGTTFDNGVLAITAYNNELYIGGGFRIINGISGYSFIAKIADNLEADTCGEIVNDVEINEQTRQIRVYPNPTVGRIIISGQSNETLTITLFDLVGVMVKFQEVFSVSSHFTTQIDISNLPKGMYMIKISSAEGFSTHRIFVQ